MLRIALLALQIAAPQTDSVDLIKLNFDPKEELKISKDSVDLENMDYSECVPIQTVHPLSAAILSLTKLGEPPHTVKIQECFVRGTDKRDKRIVITYYDLKLKIKTPIAFVAAWVVDSNEKRVAVEIWGLVDLGFFKNGRVSREWLTIYPKPNATIKDQLIGFLKPGFDKAKKRKK